MTLRLLPLLASRWLRRRTVGPREVEAAYDAVAPTYPAWTQRMQPHLARIVAAEVFAPLAPGPVLDLCCGDGAATTALRALDPGFAITGVDRSQGMLDRYRIAHPGAAAVRADALGFLATGRAPWAAVVCAWGMAYLGRPLLRASWTRLRPGGVLAVLVNRRATLPGVTAAVLAAMAERPRAVERIACFGAHLPPSAVALAVWARRAGLEPLSIGAGAEEVAHADAEAAWRWLDGTGAGAGITACFADPAAARPALLRGLDRHLPRAGDRLLTVHRFAWLVARRPPCS